MNTLRYKPEYREQVIGLLQNTPNTVELPSDVFFDIAKMFGSEIDGAKLDKLLAKAYTMLALENEQLVGMAAMDKEGNIGIFAVNEGGMYEKASRLLLGALERRAEKKEIHNLFVLKTDASESTFKRAGYEPFDNASGGTDAVNEFQLVKKITTKQDAQFAPESVRKLTLDRNKPVKVEGKVSIFPAVFFGMACFFIALLITITVTTYDPKKLSDFVVISVVVGLLFVAATALFIAYLVRGSRLRKEVLSMHITNGVVVSVTAERSNYNADNESYNTRIHLTYVYYDEEMTRREARFSHTYRFNGPYFFEGQELVVACAGEKSYILHKYTVDDPQGQGQTVSDETEPSPKPLKSSKDLSGYVPLGSVKWYYIFALCFFSVIVVVTVVLSVFSALAAAQTGRTFFEELFGKWPFFAFVIPVFGGFTCYYLFTPLITNRRYKKLLNKSDKKVVSGKIVYSSNTYQSSNKYRFFCEYTAAGEKCSIRVPSMFASRMVRYGDTAVLVICDKKTALVLVRKGRFPDRILHRF